MLLGKGGEGLQNIDAAVARPPSSAHIGLTNRCNLSCQMCPAHSASAKFASGGVRVDPHLLEAALNGLREFSGSLRLVGLTDFGEPFLYKEIFDIIAMIHDICPRAAITVTSNGTLLTDPLIEKILGSGLFRVTISLDASTKRTYEAIRRGANFEQVISGINRLMEARRRMRMARPIVTTNFVIMKSNVHELPEYVRLAKRMGVDRVGTVNTLGIFNSDREAGVFRMPGEKDETSRYTGIIAEARRVARIESIPLNVPNMVPREPGSNCSANARDFPFIDPWGDVYPCCTLAARGRERGSTTAPMGNIKQSSLGEIWRSERYSRFRRAFYTERLPDPVCAGCPRYYHL